MHNDLILLLGTLEYCEAGRIIGWIIEAGLVSVHEWFDYAYAITAVAP